MKYEVTISESALRMMTLATLEAYALGDGRKRRSKNEIAVETLGYLWGVKRVSLEGTFIHVDMASMSISAKRSKDGVTPNKKAIQLKAALMDRWAPHLTLMGDFHSHPYANHKEVKKIQGFEFSNADEEAFLGDDFVWDSAEGMPIMIVMTVCKLSKVNESLSATFVRNNINSFDVGEYRFWLNVAIGYLKDETNDHTIKKNRQWTGNKHSSVELRLDSRFYNYSSDRLEN